MNYKVNILGKSYDLPARTLAVDEQIEEVGSLDAEYKAKRMTRREVVERMHAWRTRTSGTRAGRNWHGTMSTW